MRSPFSSHSKKRAVNGPQSPHTLCSLLIELARVCIYSLSAEAIFILFCCILHMGFKKYRSSVNSQPSIQIKGFETFASRVIQNYLCEGSGSPQFLGYPQTPIYSNLILLKALTRDSHQCPGRQRNVVQLVALIKGSSLEKPSYEAFFIVRSFRKKKICYSFPSSIPYIIKQLEENALSKCVMKVCCMYSFSSEVK